MTNRDSTEPITPHERAAIARLLQACCEVLQDERIRPEDGRKVLRQLLTTLDRGMLAVRREHPWIVERITSELDRFVETLIKPYEESPSLVTRPHDWQHGF